MVRDLARNCMTAELLQPDELVSGLMAQVWPLAKPWLPAKLHTGPRAAIRAAQKWCPHRFVADVLLSGCADACAAGSNPAARH